MSAPAAETKPPEPDFGGFERENLLDGISLPTLINLAATSLGAISQGTLPQHRVTKLSPRPAGEEELVVRTVVARQRHQHLHRVRVRAERGDGSGSFAPLPQRQ